MNNPILSIEGLGPQWPTRDPFLFCAHHDDRYPRGNAKMGPSASLAGRTIGQDFSRKDGWSMYHGSTVPGFPQHPHRGFETVSIVRTGLMDHSDSLGAKARFGGGDVQWLTAGGGILHSEMFPLLETDKDNRLEMFQVWLNLPAADKMVKPYFSMLWQDTLAVHEQDGTRVTLIAGDLGELRAPASPPDSWAAKAEHDVAIWTIKMAAGARFELPAAKAGSNRTLYFFAGKGLKVAGREVPEYHLVDLVADTAVVLEAAQPCEMLLLQGQPIGEPVARYGPFVMNTDAEIRQAFADYQRTQFGGWPWPGDAPVHGRDQGRFAQHADGRVEKPA
ncbi:MAG: pirin family protein [Planctomycetota bacterium]